MRVRLASLLFVLSACIVEGTYVVRGQVMTDSSGLSRLPVEGASVAVGDTDGRTANGRARTSADGSYAAVYRFGGMFPFIRGAHPSVEFAAPGYQARKVDLRSSTVPPGFTRGPCVPPEKGCFVLDVVLVSEVSATLRP